MHCSHTPGIFTTKIRNSSLLAMTVLLLFLSLLPALAQAQSGNPDPLSCYGVGDEWLSADGTATSELDPNGAETDFDYLAVVNQITGVAIPIGPTNTRGIEAIAFVPEPDGPIFNILFAVANEANTTNAAADTLGTIDLTTGIWTALNSGTVIGSGNGPDGANFTMTDIDGLTYDVQRSTLWATQRNGVAGAPDYLMQIDMTTGQIITDTFGEGIDWVPVEVATDPRFVTPAGQPYDDIDDLAVDPTTGQMYAIMNKNGIGGGLVKLDPANGSVIEYIGLFTTDEATSPDAIADDMEGLAFFNDGRLYASSGNNGPQSDDSDRLYQIAIETGQATLIDAFPAGVQDIESLGCLTAPAFIQLEKATNGEDADEPTGPSISLGSEVVWTYVFTNTGNAPLINITLADDILGDISDSCAEGALPDPLTAGDAFTCTVTGTADTEGQYANIGTVDSIYLTTGPTGTINIPLTDSDPSHYIGTTAPQPGISIVKTAGSTADGETHTISQPALVTFNYEVTNTGSTHLTDITITDDAGTPDDASDDVTLTSAECADLAGPFAPSDVVICTAEIEVTQNTTNIAETIGTPSDGNGTPLPNVEPPTDTDDAVVILPTTPGLTLQKTVYEGHDSGENCAGDELVEAPTGTEITYCFEVTNSGTTHQNDVTVQDSDLGISLTSPDLLASGESVMLFYETTLEEALINTANATAVPSEPNGDPIPELENQLAIDTAEVIPLSRLGNIVWLDANFDGIQNALEEGIAGVEVTLFDEDGNVLQTQITDENGLYGFNVQPGNYSIGFNIEPLGTGYFISPQDAAGVNDRVDSDADENNGRTIITTLTVGETDPTWDAGIFAPPILQVMKSDGNAPIEPGELITYTINYSNTGSSDAMGVVITESIPQYTTFSPNGSTFGWSCDSPEPDSTCTFEIGIVEKGTTGTLDLVFVVAVDEQIPENVTTINNVIQISDDGTRGTPPTAQTAIELSTPLVRIPTAIEESREPISQLLYVPVFMSR